MFRASPSRPRTPADPFLCPFAFPGGRAVTDCPENPDPQFGFAFHVAGQRHARGLNMRVRDPRALERLQSESPKIDS